MLRQPFEGTMGSDDAAGTVSVESAVSALVGSLFPGARSLVVERLGADESNGGGGETHKAVGYAEPLRVRIVDAGGQLHDLVLHVARADDFGHDRRSDRAQGALLSFDTFSSIPGHVEALDVGTIQAGGALLSLREAGEFYLLTRFAPGELYARALHRVARSGLAERRDLDRVERLARFLVELHRRPVGEGTTPPRTGLWRRAVRDLLGHGECIFGVIDNYPDDTPAAPAARLRAIEEACLAWRWRLRGRSHRLRRTHGDFHPFNLLFDEHEGLHLLDASRGAQGDPADDVAALCVNFPFFALDNRAGWARGPGALWRRFLEVYLDESGDQELLEVLAPFLAFRILVVANPVFYPALAAADRDRLLGWIERALAAPRFDPASVEVIFAAAREGV